MKLTFAAPALSLKRSLAAAGFVAFACSAVSADARANGCAEAVAMARDNISLRINGGDNSANSRESAKVRLYRAEEAAAGNDEGRCWNQIWWSAYFIGIPGPVAVQMQEAAAIQQRLAAAPEPYQPRWASP